MGCLKSQAVRLESEGFFMKVKLMEDTLAIDGNNVLYWMNAIVSDVQLAICFHSSK